MDGEGEDLGLLDGTGEEVGGGGGEEESFIEESSGDDAGDHAGDEAGGGADDQDRDQGTDGERSPGAIVKVTPDIVKKALREISAKDPEFAKKFPTLEKTLTTALYKDTRIRALGGLQAINQLAETVEAHGGVEGIEQAAEELRLFRDMEGGMKKGDPLIIDGWLKDYPSGLKRLLLPAIEKIAKVDEAFIDRVRCHGGDVILTRCGVYACVTKLGEALTAGKVEDAVKLFNTLVSFLADFKNHAAAAKGGTEDTGASAELDEREKAADQRDRDTLYRAARLEVNPLLMADVNKLIRRFLPQGKKIRVDQANRLRKEINTEARAAMNAKKDFAGKFEDLMQAGDQRKLAKFILDRARAELPRVVQQLLREHGLRGTAGGGGSAANGGGVRRVVRRDKGGEGGIASGKPNRDDIDWTKTDKAVWLTSVSAGRSTGPIFLKNGKRAQW